MSAKDRIYTGKVGEWGLPDWTVIKDRFGTCHYLNALADTVQGEHTIEKLPAGYKFNEQGEIIKVEQKRYWNGKEPLEVGVIVGKKSSQKEHEVLKQNKRAVALLELQSGHLSWCNKRDLASLVKTDKQKLIDKYSEIFFNSDKNVIDVIGMVYDELADKDA